MELDETDACIADEPTWFDGLQRVWLRAERVDVDPVEPLEHGCVGAEGVSTWSALESRLREKGDLLSDLPIGPEFHVYLAAVQADECPDEEGPRVGDIRFCAYSRDPIVLDRDRDVEVEVVPLCQGLLTWRDCYTFARRDQQRED